MVTPGDGRESPSGRCPPEPQSGPSRGNRYRTESSPALSLTKDQGAAVVGAYSLRPRGYRLMGPCHQLSTSTARSASSYGRCNIRHAESNARMPPAAALCECHHGRLCRWERPWHCKLHGHNLPSTTEPGRPGTATWCSRPWTRTGVPDCSPGCRRR